VLGKNVHLQDMVFVNKGRTYFEVIPNIIVKMTSLGIPKVNFKDFFRRVDFYGQGVICIADLLDRQWT
jgi:hypothetical protein